MNKFMRAFATFSAVFVVLASFFALSSCSAFEEVKSETYIANEHFDNISVNIDEADISSLTQRSVSAASYATR